MTSDTRPSTLPRKKRGIWERLFGPEHCMTCGDEFIEATYSDGYRRDGSLIVRTWKKCPRSDDLRWEPWDRWQIGRCSGPGPFACAIQMEAYRNHKPPWRACSHYSVSEDGADCSTKDGHPITRNHRRYSRLLEERPKVAPESEGEKREAFGK